jgi:hypothetical protein
MHDSLILQSVLRSATAVPPCLCLATMSLLHLGSSASCKVISVCVSVPSQSLQATNRKQCSLHATSCCCRTTRFSTGMLICVLWVCGTACDIVAWSLMSSVASKPSLDNCRAHHQDLLPWCRPTPRRSNCQPGDQHTHRSAQLTDTMVHDTFGLSRRCFYVRSVGFAIARMAAGCA